MKYLFKRNVQVEPAQWQLGTEKQKHQEHVVQIWRHVWNDNVHIYSTGLIQTEVRRKSMTAAKNQNNKKHQEWLKSKVVLKHELVQYNIRWIDNMIKGTVFHTKSATQQIKLFSLNPDSNSFWQMLSFSCP